MHSKWLFAGNKTNKCIANPKSMLQSSEPDIRLEATHSDRLVKKIHLSALVLLMMVKVNGRYWNHCAASVCSEARFFNLFLVGNKNFNLARFQIRLCLNRETHPRQTFPRFVNHCDNLNFNSFMPPLLDFPSYHSQIV
jgi:hypothetical protein